METQKSKVMLYVKRPFGEKMNASFAFIKENWKLLLKLTTYLLLPVSLLQALSLNGLMSGLLSMSALSAGMTGMPDFSALAGIVGYYFATLLLYMIGSLLLCSLVYALMRTYQEREERLAGVTLSMLKSLLLRNVRRMLIALLLCTLGMFGVILLMGLLVALTPYTLLLTVPMLIAIYIPLLLLFPIYLIENVSWKEAFSKCFHLGFATWGGTLLLMLVMGLLAGILQGVTTLPWYIAIIVKYAFSMSEVNDGGLSISAGYSFFLYLTSVLQTFGAYLSLILPLVGMGYQYGHASEVVDGITVESDIEQFSSL